MDIRGRIIEHSTAQFVTHGLRSVRMDDIATALGISKRTLYESFGDKESLIEACVKHFFAAKMAEDCRRCASAGNVVEELVLHMTASEESAQKSFTLMNDLRKFYPTIHQQITDENIEVGTREMKQMLCRGIEQGLILPSVEVDEAVLLFIDLMETTFARLNALAVVSGRSLARTLRRVVLIFARGIATQQGVALIDDYITRNQEMKLI